MLEKGPTDRPKDGRTKPLIELLFATKNVDNVQDKERGNSIRMVNMYRTIPTSFPNWNTDKLCSK